MNKSIPKSPARRPRSRRTAATRGAPVPGEAASLTDVAYTALEEMIVRLELPPGTVVSETMLSEALGIGRTPIREALQRLAREKLVQILPRRGIVISEINVRTQLRLLELRREVERLVARSAARRATTEERNAFSQLARRFEAAAAGNDDVAFMRTDREFNDLCLVAARNEFAAAAMANMQSLARRFWYHHYRQAADMPEAARLHADVARAIADGREAAAAAALDTLLDNIESFTRATASAEP